MFQHKVNELSRRLDIVENQNENLHGDIKILKDQSENLHGDINVLKNQNKDLQGEVNGLKEQVNYWKQVIILAFALNYLYFFIE